ncbi:hypothetical protein P168DRAFT_300774 [Aspergillus campestris IBT 28561]|uniref:Uncharacterized protein n=1 Tax=Aspergillus campestris (strain IBT 28561) TaxID=1392248 RepID=A0A2I1DDQ3_ASPC2|nr:uncharacterized protein P168DRAFT_300774 [Aspergillus campestris IBT 28561]PKY07995.1 hypothetical protein P168DRAFT_300774 [Aspergillus campestris IBT 28561]
MPSPSFFKSPRQAPPMRPSRSLEGLERVIPPRFSDPPGRSTVHLDKPLPELPVKPLPETPSMEGSTAWSEDSSLVDSLESHRHSGDSTESYPVFVRPGSADLSELVDHAAAPDSSLDRASSSGLEDYVKHPPLSKSNPYLSDEDYEPERPIPLWNPTPTGPNHYFREKKWDFFPELATPSAMNTRAPPFPTKPQKNSSQKPSMATLRSRGLSLAHDVRDSIRSYVQRRLSRNSVDKEKTKREQRPATAPDDTPDYLYAQPARQRVPSSQYSDHESTITDMKSAGIWTKRLSVTSATSTAASSKPPLTPLAASRRKKQLAVPLSAYQKYGPAIWEKPSREKRISYRQNHRVRFPRYRRNTTTPRTRPGSAVATSTPLPSPTHSQLQRKTTRERVRALQSGTSHVLVALDGARKRIIGARVERKHSQLKSQIRLVGPVNPYQNLRQADTWI